MNTPTQYNNALYDSIRQIVSSARQNAYRAVNFAMVEAYWNIGRLIVEEEQQGASRAEYGKYLLKDLSQRLAGEFGQGFSAESLKQFRKFYLVFPKGLVFGEIAEEQKGYTLCTKLSWSHYRLIMRVENPKAREYYIREAVAQNWSVRALQRQIHSLYYERLLSSRNTQTVKDEADANTQKLALKPEDFLKDPYILEFLNLNPDISYLEKDLEPALIDKLQHFLLELGKGFAFVARQQRISTETKEFYIDLVFYNYLLKCFVLIDLKTGELTHQNIGQMDMYVRLYEDRCKASDDNPTIGIVLCSEKDETVVHYSGLNDNEQLFASKYRLYLPSEQELAEAVNREKYFLLREKQQEYFETQAHASPQYAYAGKLAHTYSIVARDPESGEMGGAVQSHWFSVGRLVTWAEAGVGAIATQAFVNCMFGQKGLELLHEGHSAPEVLQKLLDADEGRDLRQVAIIDAQGNIDAWTGKRCVPEAGHIIGDNFSVQANLMLNETVCPAMAEAFQQARGHLAERMLSALEAAQNTGGDLRGKQSAALLVVGKDATGKLLEDRQIDLRVDDHPSPVQELKRLLKLHRAYRHMDAGDLALERHDVDGALREYGAAEDMFPDNLEMKFWHAVSLANIDRIEESVTIFHGIFEREESWKIFAKRLKTVGMLQVSDDVLEKILSV